MASDTVLELTNDNFQAEVLESDQPVLVDFWAEWCMPCRMLAPVIDKIADTYDGKVKVGKLDTEAARDVAVQYGISSIPTVILFKGGEPAKTLVGMQPEAAYASELDALLG
ncbi:MAG: thioredoxin [Planctomycetota bacterium]